MKNFVLLCSLGVLSLADLGCSSHKVDNSQAPAASADTDTSPQTIAIDGSSTVFPITEAVAEEFQKTNKVRVTIGVSGTGGGFKKFCANEIAVAGASRPIKASEVDQCRKAGIEYIELPVAYDGIVVAVHKDSTFADSIKVDDLKRMWEPAAQGKIKRWNQIREDWPDQELLLFGAGVDSGTYDYFTKAIVGEEHSSRGDFTSSEDDNVLVQGVATAPGALGFFGIAYFEENKDKLRLLAVDPGTGPIKRSVEIVANGTYQPLSRPILIYVSKKAADRPEVVDFVTYYLTKGRPLVKETGYIALPERAYAMTLKRFNDRVTGTLFADGTKIGVTVEQLLAGE